MTPSMTAVSTRLIRLREAVTARLVASDAELAAIEVVPDDAGQRDDDLRLVREALDEGASLASLGTLLVTVVTDFAYEVDWKDQFSFWPRLHDHLRSRALNLHDHAARHGVATAFERFSLAHRGVSPVGELARHFPLMAWPLVHAVMPWCAQRHVAHVLHRAASMGIIPDDPDAPWPEGQAEALAASMPIPLFAQGIIENPSVLRRLGRVLLEHERGPTGPAWIQRTRRRVDQDAITRSTLAGAKAIHRGRVAGRAARTPSIPVTLALQAEGPSMSSLSLWASMGPYGRAVASSPEVLAFARSGAALVARANGADAGKAPLFNALTAAALVELKWRDGALTVQPSARPFEGTGVPAILKQAEEGAARTFEPPLVLRGEDARRYVHAEGVTLGDNVAVLAAPGSELAATLQSKGFVVSGVRGTSLVALFGEVGDAIADVLSAAHVAVRARVPRLEPALLPALRVEGERLVFRAGRDVWLRLLDAPAEATLRAVLVRREDRSTVEVEVGEAASGDTLVRVPRDLLSPGVQSVRVFAGGRERALASVEIAVEAGAPDVGLARWRLALNPNDASIEHLRAGQCWLEADAIPGVQVEVALRAAGRSVSAPLESITQGALGSARFIADLADRLITNEAESVDRVELCARAVDEPESWVTIADLSATCDALRFDLSAGTPVVIAPDGAPQLVRLRFAAGGVETLPAAPDELRGSGIFLARVGASSAALCVCEAAQRVPRLTAATRFDRSIARSVELISTLRAVDVAAVWPESSRGYGTVMRHAAARMIERELVGSLCGRAWIAIEDDLPAREQDPATIATMMASLLWVDARWLRERVEDCPEDPLELLHELLERIGDVAGEPDGRHLTLTYYRRGMTSPSRDEAAVRWAWASVRRARAARACYLVYKHILNGMTPRGDGDGDS